ncbi:MAG: glycosyltransferase family 39 protein, partial [Myxococcota bacterium]
QLGARGLPLAINQYTGGPPDWPAHHLYTLTGSVNVPLVFHVVLGGVLLLGVFRFLRRHGTDVAAAVAALVLAVDWSFVFYKRALGGTELALQAGLLLCLWATWDRRWGSGQWGLMGFAFGVGLGLMAKLTFALPLFGLMLAALVTRWDKPPMKPPMPLRRQLLPSAILVAVMTAPLWGTWIHHLWLPQTPRVHSHDFPSLQLRRVLKAVTGQGAPDRESLVNLYYWALEPLGFFRQAYGVDAAPQPSAWRAGGWLLVLSGIALGWRDRHPTPQTALLRMVSVAMVLQVGIVWVVARDLHHLAMLAPMQAILIGLAVEHLCAMFTPPRSRARARLALLLSVPWLWAGMGDVWRTDAVLAQIDTPTFTRRGQNALVKMLRDQKVERLVASDYELYGLLEILTPDIDVTHGWAATSRRYGDALPGLLRQAEGGHFLVIRASAPMIYNLRPSRGRLAREGQALGLDVQPVASLPDDAATLYAVAPLEGPPAGAD